VRRGKTKTNRNTFHLMWAILFCFQCAVLLFMTSVGAITAILHELLKSTSVAMDIVDQRIHLAVLRVGLFTRGLGSVQISLSQGRSIYYRTAEFTFITGGLCHGV
jgi:hypothetical protein